MKLRTIGFLVLALLMALVFPALNNVDAQTANVGYVRVFHASLGAPAVDIYLDNGAEPAISGLAYGEATEFVALSSKTYLVTVVPAGGAITEAVSRINLFVAQGRAVNVVAHGVVGGNPRFVVNFYTTDLNPVDGSARVDVIHVAPGAPTVDVLANGEPLTRVLAYGQGTLVPLTVPEGTYDIDVVATGAAANAAPVAPGVELSAGVHYTVLALPTEDGGFELETFTANPLLPGVGLVAGETGEVRFIHAASDAPDVDIYLNNSTTPVVSGVAYGSASDLLEVPAGTYVVQIRAAGEAPTSTPVFEAPLIVGAGATLEVAALGTLAGETPFSVGAFSIDRSATNGKARIFAIHAQAGGPAVDLYTQGNLILEGLEYGAVSEAIEVDPGTYTITGVASGTRSPVVAGVRLATLEADTVYTVVAVTRVSGVLSADALVFASPAKAAEEAPAATAEATAEATPEATAEATAAATAEPTAAATAEATAEATPEATAEATAEPTAAAEGGTSTVRITHASPGAPDVDIYLNDSAEAAVAALTFGASTDLIELPAGEHTVAIRPAGEAATAEPVYETTITLEEGATVEIVAQGVLGGEPTFGLELYTIDRADTAGNARVIAIHVSPDAPAVDVFSNGEVVIEGLEFGQVAEALDVPPGTYTFPIVASGTRSPVVASVRLAVLEADTVYTVIVYGSAAEGPLTAAVLTSAGE